jgi:YNFM family putative membrane transporter
MRRTLVDLPPPLRSAGRREAIRRQLRNGALLRATAVGCAFFFSFVGIFSYVTYRLQQPPFDYGTAASSAVFGLWLLGLISPFVGRLADRLHWRQLSAGGLALAAGGIALTFPAHLPTLVVGLALFALGNFSGVLAAQMGVASSSAVDRGVASALFFSCYYTAGALGAYLPGVAWQDWRWEGVAAVTLGTLAAAAVALAAPGRGSA